MNSASAHSMDATCAGRTRAAPPLSPASVTRIRTVPPRRLAHVLRPAPGESFASWIDRYAADNALTPGEAAGVLGLECREADGSLRPVYFGTLLTARSLAALTARTGLDAQQVEAMQLARYHGTALDLSALDPAAESTLAPVARTQWALFTSSRACPHCLAESPVWPLWWRLGVAAVCPRHLVLLVDACPLCRTPLRRGARRHFRGLPRRSLPESGVCGARYGGGQGRCPQPMAQLPTVGLPVALAALQRTALGVADGEPASVAGRTVEGAEWFAALRYLTAAFRLAPSVAREANTALPSAVLEALEPQREARRSGRGGADLALTQMPPTAAGAAIALAAGVPLLSAPGQRECAALLEPLARALAAYRSSMGRDPLAPLRCPPALAGALEQATPFMPAQHRIVGAMPPAARRRRSALSARHLPHLADPSDYEQLIAGYLPGTAPRSGRRLAALSAARMLGEAKSWAATAAAIGMDPARAREVADTVLQRITDPPGYWAEISTLLQRLEQRGPVDYAARRAALRGLREVPYGLMRDACRPLGSPVTIARRRHAAAWIWARLTSGDIREAPAYRTAWPALPSSIREMCGQFERWLPPSVADALHEHGIALLAHHQAEP